MNNTLGKVVVSSKTTTPVVDLPPGAKPLAVFRDASGFLLHYLYDSSGSSPSVKRKFALLTPTSPKSDLVGAATYVGNYITPQGTAMHVFDCGEQPSA